MEQNNIFEKTDICMGVFRGRLHWIKAYRCVDAIKKKYPYARIHFEEISGRQSAETVNQVFQEGRVNLVISDYAVVPGEENSGKIKLLPELRASGVTGRRDTRGVLITRRRERKYIPAAKVIVEQKSDALQVSSIYDGVLVAHQKGVNGCIKALLENECNGIFMMADDVKLIKRDRVRGLKYNYLDYKTFVPLHGQAVSAMITYRDSLVSRMMQSISDENTAACLNVEQEILTALRKPGYCYDDLRVYVDIDRNNIAVYVYVYADGVSRKYRKRSSIAYKNLLIRNICAEIWREYGI